MVYDEDMNNNENAARAFINAHLDILTAAMARWECGPEEALTKLLALQGMTR